MTTCDSLPLPGFEPTASTTSTRSAGASRARTSRWLARVRVLTESEAAYGESMRGWLANYDRASSSWKTLELCGLEDSPKFSETLPRSGMTRAGNLYLLPPLVRLIYATGCGSSQSALLPTPTQDAATVRKKPYAQGGTPLTAALLPTPTAQDAEAAGGQRCMDEGRRGLSLHAAGSRGLIPTPTASDANGSGSRNTATSKAHPGTSLTDWARGDGGRGRLLPSPGASDARNAADYSDAWRGHSPQLRHLGSGLLNPRFVEAMMLLPSGWTEID